MNAELQVLSILIYLDGLFKSFHKNKVIAGF